MSNPVQVVLNTKNYIENIVPRAGGGNKDFFAGLDEQFKEHKARLDQSLSILLSANDASGVDFIYANVELRNDAWAKSHRPTDKVFNENNTQSVVSGNELGSLIVGLTKNNIIEIQKQISLSPEETAWEMKNNKKELKTTALRSEVGAIKDIHLYAAEDRRRFSSDEAKKWLSDPRSGNSYYVESFVGFNEANTKPARLLEALVKELKRLNLSLDISEVREEWLKNVFIVIKFLDGDQLSLVENHHRVLKLLDSTAIVRSISLPPILQSASDHVSSGQSFAIPSPQFDKAYPIVGIIDAGVASASGLNEWCAGELEYLEKEGQDLSHGTFIAGLISGAKSLNNHHELDENECMFFDLRLLPPKADILDHYPRGFIDFLGQIKDEIEVAISAGVRIFNMSLSVDTFVGDEQYSLFANILDYISDKYDVIFVLPAGNLEPRHCRKSWPESENDCLKLLAEYPYAGKDRIFQPADSIRAITVGAIDPQSPEGHLKPSRYTRKGPGPALGHKPDLCHIGGRLERPHGLASISPNGELTNGCGTSYSAPLVAKTLANLDFAIEGAVHAETLKALLIHNAELPKWLNTKNLKKISKYLVGAGLPKNTVSSLGVSNHEITLVFHGEIGFRQKMHFDFAWPQSLVDDLGKCRGYVKMTTVYSPAIDRNNGAEFIVHNIDTWLRQANFDPATNTTAYSGMLKAEKGDTSIEKERVESGVKWWPVKKIEGRPEAKTTSTQCRLVVEALSRYGHSVENPIPFTVILTISDPTNTHDIFNEVRAQLQSNGVQLADIKTALRTQLRP